ncbi:MAG: hypothetical protein FJ284_07940 [Planctomycetes bacterium]|nr:hypothetical protein [Planctomycetota bacterium]
MTLRYFCAPLAVYQAACQQLDAAYGYPNAETKTQRTLPLAEELPQDVHGRVYLAIASKYAEFDLPSQIIASGSVEEIDSGAYWQMFPQRPGVW